MVSMWAHVIEENIIATVKTWARTGGRGKDSRRPNKAHIVIILVVYTPWKIHHFDGIYQERWDFHGLC